MEAKVAARRSDRVVPACARARRPDMTVSAPLEHLLTSHRAVVVNCPVGLFSSGHAKKPKSFESTETEDAPPAQTDLRSRALRRVAERADSELMAARPARNRRLNCGIAAPPTSRSLCACALGFLSLAVR